MALGRDETTNGGGDEMTLKQLDAKVSECEAAGWDVRSMPASAVFDSGVPRWIRDVLHYDLCRRWSEKRAMELAGV